MKYLILGAGPAGLAFANMLINLGEKDFLVLEAEKEAGGLCRSVIVDDTPFDFGGGHFLDVRNKEVNNFLFSFMEENEWNQFERNSQIEIAGTRIQHPIEANIWQFELETQIKYLKSIAIAGCNIGETMPTEFTKWIYWKLGERIAEDYMIPYNSKMFGDNLNQLGTYWLDKLPNVSFEETLLSCLSKKPYGTQPGHAKFYYPKKYGYGELWLRMAQNLGDKIEYNKKVRKLDFLSKKVVTDDANTYKAEYIVTTIPWMEFDELYGIPDNIKKSIQKLKFSSIGTEYFPDTLETDAHWIYYPQAELSYHRILVRHNFLPQSKGYWTETNMDRLNVMNDDIFVNKYAYPLNTMEKPFVMKELLEWCQSKQVYGLGRWGEHQHYNSDVTVQRAMSLARKLKDI